MNQTGVIDQPAAHRGALVLDGSKVSVVVPAFNAAHTIRRALASIARQTERPREVIVVDDGSQDGTAAAARACAAELGTISLQVVEQPNAGAGAARNRAIRAAAAPYVAFLDADDEWLPEKLERCLARLARADFRLVAHNGWLVENGHEREVDIARRFRAATTDPMHGLYRRGFISTSSVVALRDAVLAADGFDEGLRTGQDFDLWLKMLCVPGASFEVFEDHLTRYHVSPVGITSNTARRLADTLAIALRHTPRLYRHTGRFAASLWFRIAALHAEAALAFWRGGQTAAALATVAALPFRLVRLTVQAIAMIARSS